MKYLALLLIICAPVHADQHEVIRHVIDFEQRKLQMVNVASEFPAGGEALNLMMANWTPGSYKIRDFARNVEQLSASDAGGRILAVTRTAKNRWRVQTSGASRVLVKYRVYAAEQNVRDSYVADQYALINPVTIFMSPLAGQHLAHELRVQLPPDWSDVVTALPAVEQQPATWRAADYDQLVDSPIGAGNPEQYRFEVKGAGHRLVNFGESGYWDGTQSARDLAAIVEQQIMFWGQTPYRDDYLFFNYLNEGRGGLEHKNSTVMMTQRWKMRDREDYLNWLGLASHEFFHTWNVKRLRPVELGPFDYEQEVYSPSLWIAEGLTNYFEPLFMSRAKVATVDETLKLLVEYIYNTESTPGRRVRSVEDSSRDAWFKLYQPDANSINSNISYYQKGALVGFLLDARIRQLSSHKHSLDDVMRLAYQRYSGAEGYTGEQFKALISELTGRDLHNWVEQLVASTDELELDWALDFYGLDLDRHPDKTSLLEEGKPVPAELGLRLDEEHRSTHVEYVIHGLPAADSGILPADEILAINGERVSYFSLPEQLKRLRAGETVTVLLARNKQIREFSVTLAEALPSEYKLTVAKDIQRRQRANLEALLGQDVSPPKP